jgi:hypothetical protein
MELFICNLKEMIPNNLRLLIAALKTLLLAIHNIQTYRSFRFKAHQRAKARLNINLEFHRLSSIKLLQVRENKLINLQIIATIQYIRAWINKIYWASMKVTESLRSSLMIKLSFWLQWQVLLKIVTLFMKWMKIKNRMNYKSIKLKHYNILLKRSLQDLRAI